MAENEKLEWFPFYWLKFLVAVNKWKSAEVGAYVLLLIHQWDNGFVPETEEEIEEITGVSFQKLSKVMRKFEKVGNKFFNKRLEVIRSEQQEKNATNSNRGKKGAEARWREHKEKHAQALPEQSLTNSIRTEEKRVEKKREEENRKDAVHEVEIFPTFEDFWKLYNKKVGKENSAHEWKKVSQDDREKLMEHIPLYQISRPDKSKWKDPERYLKYKVWNDEIITSNDTGNTKTGKGSYATGSDAARNATTIDILAEVAKQNGLTPNGT